MTTGTKSLLFGVHQFLWHPYTVWRGWRALYGKCPGFWETVAIFCHDIGYWGCERMDDAKGEQHPHFGAKLIYELYITANFWRQKDSMTWQRAADLERLCLYHSRYLSATDGVTPSKLCWADKMSPVFDPPWFYLLRARLSGEIKEYRANAADTIATTCSDEVWYAWLQRKCEQNARERIPASHRAALPPDTIIPIFYRRQYPSDDVQPISDKRT